MVYRFSVDNCIYPQGLSSVKDCAAHILGSGMRMEGSMGVRAGRRHLDGLEVSSPTGVRRLGS
jgi:hypothetical protein